MRCSKTDRLGRFKFESGALNFDFPLKLGGQMLKGKKIIAIGERDGVPGPVIAECLQGAGYDVVFQATECFV
jgi:glycine/sarcosine/betaine reductase complex component A